MCVMHIVKSIYQLGIDLFSFILSLLRSRSVLVAENLFLRKQLALYQERGKKPGQIDTATKFTLIGLSKFFNWRLALVAVQPQTLVRWHRMGFRLFWRWKSRPGRPSIPEDLRKLIRQMPLRILCGARSGSQTSCFSSWASGFRPERYGNICRKSCAP